MPPLNSPPPPEASIPEVTPVPLTVAILDLGATDAADIEEIVTADASDYRRRLMLGHRLRAVTRTTWTSYQSAQSSLDVLRDSLLASPVVAPEAFEQYTISGSVIAAAATDPGFSAV